MVITGLTIAIEVNIVYLDLISSINIVSHEPIPSRQLHQITQEVLWITVIFLVSAED